MGSETSFCKVLKKIEFLYALAKGISFSQDLQMTKGKHIHVSYGYYMS